jgi:hypothetical protein
MSQGYVVRITGKKELVGVYIARDIKDLYSLVDETTDPTGCEFKVVSSGGIMWFEPNTPFIATDDDDENDLSGASFTEGMHSALNDARKWRFFDVRLHGYCFR